MGPGTVNVSAVVVPLDGTATAERALPVAECVAEACGARVQLLAVAASADAGKRLEPALRRASAHVAGHLGEARVAYDFATADRIVAACAPPDVVPCMATDWPLVRSVARRVLGRSDGPVVGRSDGPVVLVGPAAVGIPPDGCLLVDAGAPGGAAVLEAAERWAAVLGRPLVVLRPERREPAAGSTPEGAVAVAGSDLARAVVDYQRDHTVVLTAVGVATRSAGRLTRRGRAVARTVRSSRSPVLAVPLR
jgi:hypothetical protein